MKRKYLFNEMQPGDAFDVPYDGVEDMMRVRNNMAVLASNYGRRNGKRFSVRTSPGVIEVSRVDGVQEEQTPPELKKARPPYRRKTLKDYQREVEALMAQVPVPSANPKDAPE